MAVQIIRYKLIPRAHKKKGEGKTGGYGEIELQPDGTKHALLAKPPRYVGLSDPAFEEMESSPLYQDIDQHCNHPTTMTVPQESDIYTEPDTSNSHTVETDSGMYETVYSEPVQPSLFLFEHPVTLRICSRMPPFTLSL